MRHNVIRKPVPYVLVTALLSALAIAGVGSSATCSFCGRNLIKNPGAENGRGQNAAGESGNVPIGRARPASSAPQPIPASAWAGSRSAPRVPKAKGKNYFFGGTTPAATTAKASVGTQRIPVAAGAAGHTATLSGWLGNYGKNTAQVRAEFTDSAGKVVSAIRIGPDTTIGGEDMAFRTRHGKVPAGAASINIVVTFTDHANYSLAGADDLSLVLS